MTLHQPISLPSLTDYPITQKWHPSNPDVLQLYSLTTPNGVKVSIALEEMGVEYEPHYVSFADGDQFSPEFLSLNPNNKIPAIIDPNGPNGVPIGLFESGAILIYLAEKSDKLLPTDPEKRYEVLQWLMFQMGGIGPMFGQVGYFTAYAGKSIDDPRPRERYLNEARRLLGVLDTRLEGREWIVDDYSIADIAIAPWLRTMRDGYKAGGLVGWEELKNVPAYLDRFLARPKVQKGLITPAKPLR